MPAGSKKKTSAFRKMINLILLAAFGAFSYLTLEAAIDAANRQAELRLVAKEARELYDAFEKYYERHLQYPSAYTRREFDVETLDPLFSRGYYRGIILTRMRGNRADLYDSPDDGGENQEFWIEMTLKLDPSMRVLVANSDDAPLGAGRPRKGAFLYRDGALEPL